jgi:hypothetical protein
MQLFGFLLLKFQNRYNTKKAPLMKRGFPSIVNNPATLAEPLEQR